MEETNKEDDRCTSERKRGDKSDYFYGRPDYTNLLEMEK